jgi:hypothetical protein
VSIIDPALKDGAMDVSIIDFHELFRVNTNKRKII